MTKHRITTGEEYNFSFPLFLGGYGSKRVNSFVKISVKVNEIRKGKQCKVLFLCKKSNSDKFVEGKTYCKGFSTFVESITSVK